MELRRRRLRSWWQVLLIAAAFELISVRDAHAYIDPGSISFLFQALIAAFLGTLFALKSYWRGLTVRLRAFFQSKEEDEED